MREFLSVDRDANAIRLRRSTFSGTFLLVEGSSDRVFYERFVDKAECVLISISGKPSSKLKIIEVLRILGQENFQGILAIVDADFDHLQEIPPSFSNLFYTDSHDLETMLLQSPALEKVMAEFGSEEKVSNFGQDVRLTLLQAGTPIGYLRWISQLDQLNLTFQDLIFSKFIDDKILKIDVAKLIQEVRNKSQVFALKNEDLQQRLINQCRDTHDPWQVCCGHDLVEILSLGLRKALGSANASDVKPDGLERSLRLAYEAVYFAKTQIYMSIRLWESENGQFNVFHNNIF
jgi:hypothetical protein